MQLSNAPVCFVGKTARSLNGRNGALLATGKSKKGARKPRSKPCAAMARKATGDRNVRPADQSANIALGNAEQESGHISFLRNVALPVA